MSLRIHGDLDAAGAELNFAVNVHGKQPPQFLQQAIAQAIPQLAAYPDAGAEAQCRELLAQYHQVSPEEILITNGGAEGFSLLPQLQPAAVHIAHPGFAEPDYVFAHTTIPTHHWMLPAPFVLDDAACARLPQPHGTAELAAPTQSSNTRWWERQQMVILGNPTNPTGIVHHELAQLRTPGRLLVVDEAFMDLYAPAAQRRNPSMIGQHGRDVVVLRSLTKTWALAGLRLGYMVAHPDIIAHLGQLRPHWALGTLQAAALQAIMRQGIGQLPQIQAEVAAQRTHMQQALEHAGFQIASVSAAPYLLVRPCARRQLGGAALAEYTEQLRQRLADHKIAIRRCDTFPGLDASYWRLAVRPLEQVQALVEAVAAEVAQLP